MSDVTASLRNRRSGWPGVLAAACALLVLAVLPAAAAPSASSVSPTRADSVKITVPADPCGEAWGKLPEKYRKDVTIGGATLSPQTLFNKKCNEFKDDLVARMRAPFDRARAAAEAAPGQLQAAAMARLQKGFLTWAAEVAREEILPRLPPEERARYDVNSPLVQQKAHEWLNDPSRELGTYVSAYIGQKAPLINDVYKAYVDLVEGDSRKIIDGLNGILQKARARVSKFTDLERAVETAPKETPWADLLSEHGFSGDWIDNFKGYEGEIRALNEGYKIKETVTIIVGAFRTDDPRQKISGLFELIDTVSGVAQESNIPIVSLFGDIVNAYAQVAKVMLEKVNGLEKRLRERAGYCLGTGVPADDPRNDTLDARGILACPLALDRKPWSDIYETVEPTQGEILFWDGNKFIDGASGAGGKTGVQESIALMTAARDIGYRVAKSDVGAIAKVFNTPFEGGIPELMKEARKVIGEITARARQLERTVGTGGQCSSETIIAHVESMTGLRLQAFLDEINTEGQSRLVTTYAASYVASKGGFGEAGGKRAGAYDRYKEIWEKLKDVRVVTVYGEVRDVTALSAPSCAKCAGATINATISGGEEVSGCEVRTADDRGNFIMHVVTTAAELSISLTAQVKDAQGETLRLSPEGATASAKLPVKFPEEEEDEAGDDGKGEDEDQGEDEEGKDGDGDEGEDQEQACADARAKLKAAQDYLAQGKIEAARALIEAAAALGCDELEPDIADARDGVEEAVSGVRNTAATALSSCDTANIDAAIAELEGLGLEALSDDLGKLRKASAAIAAAREAVSAAEAALAGGDTEGARSRLEAAQRELQGIAGSAPCPDLNAEIASMLDRLNDLARLMAEAEAALGSCDPEPMTKAATGLRELGIETATQKASELERKGRLIGQADQAYEAAKAPYRAGQTDDALARLDAASSALGQLGGKPACSARKEKIARAIDKVKRLAELIAEAERALGACDPATLTAISKKLAKTSHPRLVELKGRIGTLTAAAAGYPRAVAAYKQGKIGQAEGHLNDTKARLDGIGAGTCPDLRRKISNGLRRIARLRQRRRAVEAAIERCDLDTMNKVADRLARGNVNPYLMPLLGMIRKKKPECVKEAAAEGCRRSFGPYSRPGEITDENTYKCRCVKGYEWNDDRSRCVRKKTREEILAEGTERCRKEFGEQAYAIKRNPNGTFQCGCAKGYRMNKTERHCERKPTREEIMAEGHQRCREEFGRQAYAVKPNPDGTFQCQCRKGYRWNPSRTRCVRAPTRAEGNRECRKNFGSGAYMVRANADGTFQCQCKKGYRWNGRRTRCIRAPRGPTMAEGHNACRKKYGLLSFAIRYRGNGRWDCFVPPKIQRPPPSKPPSRPGTRCHHRPGTSQRHCGSG